MMNKAWFQNCGHEPKAGTKTGHAGRYGGAHATCKHCGELIWKRSPSKGWFTNADIARYEAGIEDARERA